MATNDYVGYSETQDVTIGVSFEVNMAPNNAKPNARVKLLGKKAVVIKKNAQMSGEYSYLGEVNDENDSLVGKGYGYLFVGETLVLSCLWSTSHSTWSKNG